MAVEQEEKRLPWARGGAALEAASASQSRRKSEQADFDFFLDMRPFQDPDAGELRRHDGRHPAIIRRMVQKRPEFTRFLEDVDRVLSEVREGAESGRQSRVMMFCRKGRHRSVAGTLIFAHLARQSGVPCDVLHLDLERCGCELCDRSAEARLDALHDAWAAFDEMRDGAQ